MRLRVAISLHDRVSHFIFALLAALAFALTIPQAQAATFTVTKLFDTADGDCSLDCSLNEAIDAANDSTGADTISFASGLTGTIELSQQLQNVTSDITINGPGAAALTIRRNGGVQFRIFTVNNNATVVINGLTLRGGSVSGFGGAINNSATLTVNDCVLIDNDAGTASAGGGGGISNFEGTLKVNRCAFFYNNAYDGAGILTSNGSVDVTDCTFDTNFATHHGGGVYGTAPWTIQKSTFRNNVATAAGGGIHTNAGDYTVTNTTFSANSSSGEGGGIYNAGDIILRSCTLVSNSAPTGGGVRIGNDDQTLTFGNNIFETGTLGTNLSSNDGTLVDEGFNLFSDNGSGLLTQASNQINTDPQLGPLQDNGGPTLTYSPLKGSLAIDRGNSDEATDQRGVARPVYARPDIGAVEFNGLNESLVVTTLADENDGTSDPAFGTGTSLREAINFAARFSTPKTITFANTLSGSIILSEKLGFLESNLTILGPTAKQITIEGTNFKGIVDIGPRADVKISNLSFVRGALYSGGAMSVQGNLTLDNCTFSENHADFRGGALYIVNGTTTLRNCTFSGNYSSLGGAIYNDGAKLSVDSCTFSGNYVVDGSFNNTPNAGAAIYNANEDSDTSTTIRNSILAGNIRRAPAAGGAVIVADVDKQGAENTFLSTGYNLVGGGSAVGAFSASGDKVIGSASPNLGPLANNDGPTNTMALLAGSPALNAGDTTLGKDQRGVVRPRGIADDIGAFEIDDTTPAAIVITTPGANASISALPAITGTATDNTAVTAVTITLRRNSDSQYWTGATWGSLTNLSTVLSGPVNNRTWTRTAALPSGANLAPGGYEVAAYAADGFNNVTGITRSFTITVATKPSVTATAPANGSFIKALTTAGGTVTDAAGGPGIARVEVSLKRVSDGKFWSGTVWGVPETQLPTSVSGGVWIKNTWPAFGANVSTQMQEGKYVIAAKATDKAGGVSSATAASKTEFTVDRTVPASVTIINPVLNAKIKGLTKINGTATDDNQVTSVTYTYKRNSDNKFWTGTAWGAETVFPTNLAGPVNNRSWSTGVNSKLPAGADLPLGNYGIFVTATDAAGNKTTLPRSFNITESVPPTASITSPANASTVSAFTLVTGTANDLGGSNLLKVAFTLRRNSDSKFWNGTEWTATSFDLSTSMTTADLGVTWKSLSALPKTTNLLDGSYRIVATATDKAGNIGSSVVSQFTLKRTAATPTARASRVQLSSASAKSDGTIQLIFTGAISGTATDASNYTVSVNGEVVEITSAQLTAPTAVILTADEFAAGAKVAVGFALEATDGSTIVGMANAVVK